MNELDIALDVEGVLADTHAATAERSDFLEPRNCPPPNWEFPSDEHFEEFMHVSQNLWHNHSHEIPPMVDGLWKATRKLSRRHNVDIVTSRTNVDSQIIDWLNAYNVYYEDFHVARDSKNDVGHYDVHVDDSPSVAAEALADHRCVVLIDRPYNQSFENSTRLTRVSDVSEACEFLSTVETNSFGRPVFESEN